MVAALFWFPLLFLVGKMPGVHFGVEQATMNWWFGHNVLGLFYTPLALARVYYFLPKIIGRPVQSYNLSLLGFWTLAFFYGQVGGHHLIGGPVPGWLITLSIVQSMMMMVPVVAFTINHAPDACRGALHRAALFADAALHRAGRHDVHASARCRARWRRCAASTPLPTSPTSRWRMPIWACMASFTMVHVRRDLLRDAARDGWEWPYPS